VQLRLAGAAVYPADEIQRSLAVRSVTTPFALAAAKPLGGQPDLVALFVVVTGVFGMAVGDMLFLRLPSVKGWRKGGFGGVARRGKRFNSFRHVQR
jgi:putative effector of murein hydrolase